MIVRLKPEQILVVARSLKTFAPPFPPFFPHFDSSITELEQILVTAPPEGFTVISPPMRHQRVTLE